MISLNRVIAHCTLFFFLYKNFTFRHNAGTDEVDIPINNKVRTTIAENVCFSNIRGNYTEDFVVFVFFSLGEGRNM